MAYKNEFIVSHYSKEKLFEKIVETLKYKGINKDQIRLKDLKYLDEFHVGGLKATHNLLNKMIINSKTNLLDIGSGIGGLARLVYSNYKANVTGIDLTPSFIETAKEINNLLGLKINYRLANALRMPFNDSYFDIATMLHVGMNLFNKKKLFKEVSRVLVSRGCFAIYDIMIVGSGDFKYPVPWATTANTSFVKEANYYRKIALSAGFILLSEKNKKQFALKFLKKFKENYLRPDPLSLGSKLLMGENYNMKLINLVKAIEIGHLAPVEMIFKKN